MSNSHGELFTEIGKLVLAANSGQPIDLERDSQGSCEALPESRHDGGDDDQGRLPLDRRDQLFDGADERRLAGAP